LPGGIRFGILDGFIMQVKPEMVGKVKALSLIIPVAKINRVPDGKWE